MSILPTVLTGSALSSARPNPSKPLPDRALAIIKENCLACHGVLKTSGLDLRTPVTLLKGGTRGTVIMPGSAEKSTLYRFVSGMDKLQMPPVKKLSPQQIADLKAWIDAGAKWPDGGKALDDRPWAFRTLVRPAVPKIRNAGAIGNPIDNFIFAKLEEKGLQPSPRADKHTLIRRATLDLTGLPPTPAEVESFLKDSTPSAYEKLIDRLLASPHYGERWGRHWLDLTRYAESEGFKADEMRPNAWRYRDYVIQSLNADKPYNRFIKEQLAGDELYPEDPDALVATGFCRHWADESNARNLRLRRQEVLNDITDVTGATLLGVTVGCARCHNHKFDPISQKDYYRLQAFFAAVHPRDDIVLLSSDKIAMREQKQRAWEEKTKTVRTELATLEEPVRHSLYMGKYNKFPADVKEAIDCAPEKRTSLQWLLYHKAATQLEVTTAEITGALKAEPKKQWTELNKQLDAFNPIKPAPLPLALGVTDIGADAPKTFTLKVGVYDQPIEEVQPGFLSVVTNEAAKITPLAPSTTGRRAALANWIASPENPLTARVMVNRLWHYHFGRGLVGTPSDFGAAGEQPTHPELLDWLATEFTKRGWSLKQMHRLIMTSATYQQSSGYNAASAKADRDNSLLWRYSRHRLEGEAIRDAMLSVSGELNPQMGGPGVMAELPKGITTRGYWKDTTDKQEGNRRSVYLFVKRNLRYPLFQAFDFPDTHEPCSRREVTTTAPQALMLMNDETVLRYAQALAGRVLNTAGSDRKAQVIQAYRLAFTRLPDAEEQKAALAFLERQAALIASKRTEAEKLVLPAYLPKGADEASGAALVDLCHALLNSNEFVYVE
jgi:mono/diheme cytochrome c family protein